MRVLLVIDDITRKGGIERVVVNLANAFVQDLGYEVGVCSLFKRYDAPHYALDSRVKLHYICEVSSAPMLKRAQRSKIYKIYYRSVFERIVSYKVWNLARDFDILIDNDHIYLPPSFLRFYNTIKTIKVFHLPFSRPRSRAKRFDHIVILSHRQYALWSQHYRNISVIPNFVTEFANHRRCDIDAQVVLSVGRMEQGDQKGFSRLIDIWEMVQRSRPRGLGWKLCLIGDGEIKQKLESIITKKGLESSIIVCPFTQAIQEVYAQASIYAMGSYYEALPMVLLEAGSMGLALIAFDIDTGPSDVIAYPKNLIQDGDVHSYATRLLELMESRSLRKECGDSARESIGKKFSKMVVLRQWEELFTR